MIQCTSCNALYDGAQMGSCPVCGSRSARAVIAAIPPAPELERLRAENEALRTDAKRYRMVRRGQQWSVVNGIGDALRGPDLDAAIDTALQGSKERGDGTGQ